jgi:hypothetical protein
LFLTVASGPIGAANSVFNEILVWEYMVGWQVQQDARGPIEDTQGLVQTKYVDRKRHRWPLSLQDPEVRAFADAHPDEQIHVHAPGMFCSDGVARIALERRFRCNQGPEVKLPLFGWLFVGAVIVSCASAGVVPVWISRFRQELDLLPWEQSR